MHISEVSNPQCFPPKHRPADLTGSTTAKFEAGVNFGLIPMVVLMDGKPPLNEDIRVVDASTAKSGRTCAGSRGFGGVESVSKVVTWAVTGCDMAGKMFPSIMAEAPAYA